MAGLLDVRSYPDVLRAFRWDALWELFDGDRDRLNLAHECVDRHVGRGAALRIKFDDGRSETHSFRDLAAWSSRFANLIARRGVERGDRVAVMLDPSLPFYGAVFGAVKRGAIAVPLFTLFGPDGVAARVEDCRPKLLLVEQDAPRWRAIFPNLDVLSVPDLIPHLADAPDRYAPDTAANDLAVFQYTSGTTRARPAAIRHTHRSVVTLMVGALYGVGLERGPHDQSRRGRDGGPSACRRRRLRPADQPLGRRPLRASPVRGFGGPGHPPALDHGADEVGPEPVGQLAAVRDVPDHQVGGLARLE